MDPRLEANREYWDELAHPVSPSRYLDSMCQGGDGLWRLPDDAPSIPLVLSLRARNTG